MPQDFYYIILDEAQFIKNEKAKVITGTPMEKHLGELWSLFNFLMPVFLSTSSKFLENLY